MSAASDALTRSIISRYARLQFERCQAADAFVKAMKPYASTQYKPSHLKSLNALANRLRVGLARLIAGDDWPEED